ncbi:MAG TPA: ribonuclease Z [Methanomassiliicoccales archaeon]|nr:ribonuclease Z [Methanomassiliicoccales archaeon]
MLECKDRYIVLDAGNGLRRLDRYMSQQKPVDLFLSHFHLDHTQGLHTLVKFVFLRELTIYGQPGTVATLDRLVNLPFTVPLDRLPYHASVKELEEGQHDIGYKVRCLPLPHASPCFGYRFEVDGKIIAYCTDTGPSENIVELGKGADLLITECAFRPGESNPKWPHLNPEVAIEHARKAGCKRLALTHFDAARYQTIEERKNLEALQADFPGLIIGYDQLRIDI